MLHYKVFTSAAYNEDATAMEAAVNAWLEETQPLVHTMTQASAGASIVVSFLYELEAELGERSRVAVAEESVEATAQENFSSAESLMITLLPHVELPY
jgi:hypothetical protein